LPAYRTEAVPLLSFRVTRIAREGANAAFCDRLAIAVLAALGVAALLTFRDYGLSWDDYTHSQYGELLLRFYASGLRDQRALSWVNLYYYGGGFDLLSALLSKISPFTLFETRRLVGAGIGIAGLILTWRTGRRVAGPLAGLVALALLATCPLYYGHMFINPKDAPFAAAMTLLLFAQVRALDEYPPVSIATVILLGLGFGVAFGTRIMGAFGGLEFAFALAFLGAVQARVDGLAATRSQLLRFVLSLLPALAIGYLVMAAVWPWAVADPLNPFRALQYFSRFFEKPWSELFEGSIIPVPDMPRSYVPTLFALKLPEIFLVLGLGGATGALIMIGRRNAPLKRRAIFLLLALAALLPVAVTIALRPAMYNGIRHFVFVLPPLAILGGFAAGRVGNCVRDSSLLRAAAAMVLVVGLALPSVGMARLHPYEYSYFNRVAGGTAGARDRFMLDYWGLSLKQAAAGLLAGIAEKHETKPIGRRWKVAVCGPHRSPEVELGPDFEMTWDPAGADFAIMLGEFYCRKFDAPLMVAVIRDGVTYARVYDIRGRSYDTLLTVPGV
jgi:hypothetical protein